MAYVFLAFVLVIFVILYALQPGTSFNFTLFNKDYSFTVTSSS